MAAEKNETKPHLPLPQTALFVWSGLGDALMAFPLLRGFRNAQGEVFLIGKESARPFYDFLKEWDIISGYRVYSRRSPQGLWNDLTSWKKAFSGWPQVLLPPRSSLMAAGKNQIILNALRLSWPLAFPILKTALGIGALSFIDDAFVPGLSSGEANRALSYSQCLERKFSLPFEKDFLFFPQTTLSAAEKAARPLLDQLGLKNSAYLVLYPATQAGFQEGKRNLPHSLISKILDWAEAQNFSVVAVGSSAHVNSALAPFQSRMINFSGEKSFLELIGIFRHSRLAFCADGGLLHLALASRCPVVSFWGPTSPNTFSYPHHPYHRALYKPSRTLSLPDAFDFSREDISGAVQEWI